MPVYIEGLYEVCEQKIHEAMYDLLDLFTILEADALKSRVKRGKKLALPMLSKIELAVNKVNFFIPGACNPQIVARATDKFLQRHSHADFKTFLDKMDRNILTSDDIKSIITHR